MPRPWGFLFIFSVITLPSLMACSTTHYLYQAARGQLQLMNRARPISEVIQSEKTPPTIKALLTEIPRIKKFGEQNGIKPTRNYVDYVPLDRPVAVWVVSASRSLRFEPRIWRFPMVGSFTYLGWFDRSHADQFAHQLTQEGWDVDVRGAQAYSTLGWFKDAVLSTMISSSSDAWGALVNVILHESVHATFYMKGQSYFNESLANFVARHLTREYLIQEKGLQSLELKSYLESEKREGDHARLFHRTYQQLERLYASAIPDSEKQMEKARLLEQLRTELGIQRSLNNATLIQFRTYRTGESEFEALYQATQKSWPRFFDTLKKLQENSFARPHQEDFVPVLAPFISPDPPSLPRTIQKS